MAECERVLALGLETYSDAIVDNARDTADAQHMQ